MTALKIWTKLIFNDDYQTISQRSTEGGFSQNMKTDFISCPMTISRRQLSKHHHRCGKFYGIQRWSFWDTSLRSLAMLTVQFISYKILYSQVKHLIKPQLKLNSKALDLVDEVDNLVYRWRNDCPRIQIILFIGVFGFKSLNYGMERSEGSP